MDNNVSIKETKEMIAALGELAFLAGQVLKDGKVSMSDASLLPSMVNKYPVLAAGVTDVDKVIEEIKDLDQTEVLDLVVAMYAAVNKFKEGKEA